MTLLLVGSLIVVFGFVVFYGAPYLPTLRTQTFAALDLLDLKPGQTLLELGSGDGRVMRAAAQRGWNVVGYELNPILVLVSYIITWKYRGKVRVIWGNFWSKPWPKADGIFVFLISKHMEKLNTKINQYPHKPIKLVSFAFKIPKQKHKKERGGLFLYEYK